MYLRGFRLCCLSPRWWSSLRTKVVSTSGSCWCWSRTTDAGSCGRRIGRGSCWCLCGRLLSWSSACRIGRNSNTVFLEVDLAKTELGLLAVEHVACDACLKVKSTNRHNGALWRRLPECRDVAIVLEASPNRWPCAWPGHVKLETFTTLRPSQNHQGENRPVFPAGGCPQVC